MPTTTQDDAPGQAMTEAELLARADAASAGGDHDAALRLWSAARSRFPGVPRPWLRAAEVLIELHRHDEADALLGDAVNRFPNDFWLARTRAVAARGRGDDVEAYTRCRALRQAYPDNPAALADFAHLLLDLKLVEAAEAETRAGLARFPDLAWLMHMYARCADQAGDTATAATRWTDLLARHPGHVPGYDAVTRALVAAGRRDEAVGIAREGFRLFPDSGAAKDAWAWIGASTAAGAALPDAQDSVGASVGESVEELVEDLSGGALGAERAGDWARAAVLWAALRDRSPTLAPAYAGGARALLRLGRIAEAEIVLAKARRDLPPDMAVLAAWADAAVARGAFADALARFLALRQAFPAALCAGPGIADALYRLGRLDEADAAYAALSAGPRMRPIAST